MEMQSDYTFYNQPRYKLVLSLATAGFFMLFFLVFQPFGVTNYSTSRIFTLEFLGILLAMTLLIFTVLMFNEFILRTWLIREISLAKIIGWSIWTFIFLGLTMFLFYNWLGDWHDFTLKSAAEFVLDITSVSIFPLEGTFFYFRYKNLHEAFEQVESNTTETADHNQLIQFKGQGVNDNITLSLADFIYGKAQDNYVELFYRENDRIAKSLIRTSLSGLTENLPSHLIVRCHRSYIVNLYHVKAFSKGSDMKLFLNFVDAPILVSKSYRNQVDELLSQVKNFV